MADASQLSDEVNKLLTWAAAKKISRKSIDILIDMGFNSLEAIACVTPEDLKKKSKVSIGQQRLVARAVKATFTGGEAPHQDEETEESSTISQSQHQSANVLQPGAQQMDESYAQQLLAHLRQEQTGIQAQTVTGLALLSRPTLRNTILIGNIRVPSLIKGSPNFEPPEMIRKTLADVVLSENHVVNQYTRSAGHPRLVKILTKIYSRELKQTLDPMKNIVTTVGAFEALYSTFQALVNPGDEVILFEPWYEPYRNIARLAGAVIKLVPLKPIHKSRQSEDWSFDYKDISSAFTSKTKAILLNNPLNPLGKVFNTHELQKIADLCIKHDALCIADEVYDKLIYEDRKHQSIACLNGMGERTLTVGSAGKLFSVTGWKIGWAVGPSNLISAVQQFHHMTIRGCPSILEEAVAIALEKEENLPTNAEKYVHMLCKQMEQKRNYLIGILEKSSLKPINPGGGIYIVADISTVGNGDLRLKTAGDDVHEQWKNQTRSQNSVKFIKPVRKNVTDSTDTDEKFPEDEKDAYDIRFAEWAIKEKRITLVPMSIFYSEDHQHFAEKYVRICFAKTEDTLTKAGNILTNL